MEEFYYQKMDRQKQAVYHGMLQGVRQLADQIQLPRVDGKELYDIFFQMRLDHPEIFWVVGFSWKYYPDSPNLIFVPEYLFEKGKIKEHQIALTSRVEKLARQAQGLSEWEKEKYVHDFICKNVRYDKLKKPYSHEIIGPLGQGVGVCEGIAKAVKVLCDALGLWCMIAICGNNPEKGIKYRHTWNIVRIGGQYYHLDATFDNSLTRGAREDAECRYDYFNLDDKAMFRDHEPLIAPAPACTDNGHFYYKEKKLSFTKMEEVKKRAQQAVKKGKVLTFHWRGSYLTRDVLREILNVLEDAGKEKSKLPHIYANAAQAVFRRAHFLTGADGYGRKHRHRLLQGYKKRQPKAGNSEAARTRLPDPWRRNARTVRRRGATAQACQRDWKDPGRFRIRLRRALHRSASAGCAGSAGRLSGASSSRCDRCRH